MKTNPNEPAFSSRPDDNVADMGLSKREYFAVMAMQGLLSGHYEYFTGNADVSVPEEIARYAILNADFLINALNKD